MIVPIKVNVLKSLGEVFLMKQDTIENFSRDTSNVPQIISFHLRYFMVS